MKEVQVQQQKEAIQAIKEVMSGSNSAEAKIEELAGLLIKYPSLNSEKAIFMEIHREYNAGQLSSLGNAAVKALKMKKLPLEEIRGRVQTTPATELFEESMIQLIMDTPCMFKLLTPLSLKKLKEYGGKEIMLSITCAKVRYGISSLEKGLTFLKLFTQKFNFYQKDIYVAYLQERKNVVINTGLKQSAIKDYLSALLKSKGYRAKLPAYISEKVLKKIAMEFQFSRAELEAAEDILEKNYATSGDLTNDTESDDPTFSLFDVAQLRKHDASKGRGLLFVLSKCDQILADPRESQNIKKSLHYLLTVAYATCDTSKLGIEIRDAFKHYVDKAFQKYLKTADIPHDPSHRDRYAEVISIYCATRYNTTRKTLNFLRQKLA